MQAAARELRLELHVLNASTEREFDAVFAEVIRLRAAGLVIGAGRFSPVRGSNNSLHWPSATCAGDL